MNPILKSAIKSYLAFQALTIIGASSYLLAVLPGWVPLGFLTLLLIESSKVVYFGYKTRATNQNTLRSENHK